MSLEDARSGDGEWAAQRIDQSIRSRHTKNVKDQLRFVCAMIFKVF